MCYLGPLTEEVKGKGCKLGCLFVLKSTLSLRTKSHTSMFSTQQFRILLYANCDNRLGHPNAAKLKVLFSSGLINKKSLLSSITPSDNTCTTCLKNKSTVLPFPSSSSIVSFELIHTDVWISPYYHS